MADPGFQLGEGHMANAAARDYNGALGLCPQRGPLVLDRGQGGFAFICLMDSDTLTRDGRKDGNIF